MICPRCSVAEISPETNRCVLCGFAANATAGGSATAVAEPGMAAPHPEPRLDPIAREELAQLFNIERATGGGGLVTTYIAREAETERKIVLRSLPRQPMRSHASSRGLPLTLIPFWKSPDSAPVRIA